LDLNGIVHNSWPGIDDLQLIFAECFRKIDVLVQLVNPAKLVHLALDGVAPRAKLNQQRARRFCKVKEQQEQRGHTRAGDWACRSCSANVFAFRTECFHCGTAKPDSADAQETGGDAPLAVLRPGDSEFDSNCITPGTEFMHELGLALSFLIRKKMSEDTRWGQLEIILSGTEVPGEGEHKIMDYIRASETNVSHCIYSSDADLCFLGLCTHRPNVWLLRETPEDFSNVKSEPDGSVVQVYSSDSSAPLAGKPLEFYSIQTLRECLQLELCHDSCVDTFDIERVVEDITLFCMLLGNDFLPASPTVEISEGSLDVMFKLYSHFYIDGYMTCGHGEIVMDRLEAFVAKMAELEEVEISRRASKSTFENKGNMKGRGRNRGGGKRRGTKPSRESAVERAENIWQAAAVLEHGSEAHADIRTDCPPAGLVGSLQKVLDRELAEDNEDNDDDLFGEGLTADNDEAPTESMERTRSDGSDSGPPAYKATYFADKLHINWGAAQFRKVCREYIRGLAWTLKYYCQGCCSWGWFYPFHYAPFLSDLVHVEQHCVSQIGFYIGKPYPPFQQLLAVLPPESSALLPPAYRSLMGDGSAIADFYPTSFGTDLNGKRNDWEAVCLLEFVDENRLSEAISMIDKGNLLPVEVTRNAVGEPVRFMMSTDHHRLRSSMEYFADVEHCHVDCVKDPVMQFKMKSQGRTPITYKILTHPAASVHSELVHPGLTCIFGDPPNKNAALILQIVPNANQGNVLEWPVELLGQHVQLWPRPTIGKVVGLFSQDRAAGQVKPGSFDAIKNEMLQEYRGRLAIDMSLPINPVILMVQPIRQSELGSTAVPVFGYHMMPVTFPCRYAVLVTPGQAATDSSSGIKLSKEAHVICTDINSPFFQRCGTVVGREGSDKYAVELIRNPRFESRSHVDPTPVEAEVSEQWLIVEELAKEVGIDVQVVRWVVDSVFVKIKGTTTNVGLCLQSSKHNLCRVGFARRYAFYEDGSMTFSPQSATLIEGYKSQCPLLFEALSRQAGKDKAQPVPARFTAKELFEADSAAESQRTLDGLCAFLKKSQAATSPLVRGNTALASIQAIASSVVLLEENNRAKSLHMASFNCNQLQLAGPVPKTGAELYLGSWVISTMPSGPISFGGVGMVVGIHTQPDDEGCGNLLCNIEVLLPERNATGSDLGGRCPALQGVMVPASGLLSLQEKIFQRPKLCPVEMQDKQLVDSIREQVEFYLSDKNLTKDTFFKNMVANAKASSGGFIDLLAIINCPRLRTLTHDTTLVAMACKQSVLLEVSRDGKRIRRGVTGRQPIVSSAGAVTDENEASSTSLMSAGHTDDQSGFASMNEPAAPSAGLLCVLAVAVPVAFAVALSNGYFGSKGHTRRWVIGAAGLSKTFFS
jgi:5'-3' exonuclease